MELSSKNRGFLSVLGPRFSVPTGPVPMFGYILRRGLESISNRLRTWDESAPHFLQDTK